MENNNLSAGNLNIRPSASTRVTLEKLQPPIGAPVWLMIRDTQHSATLVGYLKGQSLIVTAPAEQGNPMQPHAGLSLAVRIFIDNRPYEFNTVVRHVTNEPFPHWHLDCPEEVHPLKERQHERVRINVTGFADTDGKNISCTVREISLGGAMIAVDNQAGAVNDSLTLTLNIVINGVEYSLSLDGEIRSIRLGEPSNEGKPIILQGVAFKDLSQQDIMALAALDMLPDWNATL